ncbi:MAG: insulinase family protein [Acidobacteria bacterium]|nr:insulinase family protein [Acidobacteriota bacterium]
MTFAPLRMASPALRARIRSAILCSAVLAGIAVVAAQQPAMPEAVRTADIDDVVPVDPLITVRTLPNGMRYYVRANNLPQGRAELRLVVNAGSVLEDDDQRGLAHLVEHMSFNGTRHFPGQALGTFMQSLGMRFGAHVNAHTSFDETVYELQIPTDDPTVIDRSLLILEDWARGDVSFDPVEIDKERGVVLEEWRLGLGASERIQQAQFPLLLGGSRYADRLPIGTPEVIQSVSYRRVRQFYEDWYRPDLMAVIAVGDFDPTSMEALIRSHFGSIESPASPRPRSAYAVPDRPGTVYSVITDPEMTSTRIQVSNRRAARPMVTLDDYRDNMIGRLFASLLSLRLEEIAQTPDAPFLAARTSRGLFVLAAEMTTLDAIVATGGVEEGVAALFREVDRVVRFGFTETELAREKLNLQRGLQRSVVEKDSSPSGPLADEFIRNFMQAEPIPGIAYEFGLNQRFLPGISLEEVNALASGWMPDGNRVVAITAPARDSASLPGEGALAEVLAASVGAPLTAYVDSVSQQPLLARLPAKGEIAATASNEALGIVEWRLSNGARVVLKPTTFQQDEILFRAISAGGTSLARDEDFVPADTATAVISQGGLGELRLVDLEKALAGTTAFVRAEIDETTEGLVGEATRADLETMFQLLYLRFTAPRADPEAFQVLTDQWSVALANRGVVPETVFDEALDAALSQEHPRAQPLTEARLAEMDLDASLAFYRDRFADASDFTFVFVGSFDVETMRPLVEQYVASLPSLSRAEAARDVGMETPAGVVEEEVRSGIAPRSEVSIVFSGAFENDEAHRVIARTMAESLAGNLQGRLREDLGGTYGVRVVPGFTKFPSGRYRVTINFSCDPDRADTLVDAAFRVIDDFKRTGPTRGQVMDARAALTRDFETNSRQNAYLLNRMVSKYEFGEDVAEVFNVDPIYEQVTVGALRDAARAYLNTDRYVQVTLRPDVP